MNTEQLLKASNFIENHKEMKEEYNTIKELAKKNQLMASQVASMEAREAIQRGFISFWLDEFEGRFDVKESVTYESAQAYVEQATFFKRAYGRDDAGMIVKVTYWMNDFIPEEHQIP